MSTQHLDLIRNSVSNVLHRNSKSDIDTLKELYEAGLITPLIQERLVSENPDVLTILVSLGINPSEDVQLTAVEQCGSFVITVLKNPIKRVVEVALVEPNFIKNWPDTYAEFVKYYFKDNTLLINKWLRYAETARTL